MADLSAPGHWANRWVKILDTGLRVPGTKFRFGLDGILGLVLPTIGDAVTGVGSVALLTMGLRERVPTVILLKMIGNIGIDVLLGTLPGLGDAFDLVFKSNLRNLALIKSFSRKGGARPRLLDYGIVAFGFALAALAFCMPFLVILALDFGIRHWMLAS